MTKRRLRIVNGKRTILTYYKFKKKFPNVQFNRKSKRDFVYKEIKPIIKELPIQVIVWERYGMKNRSRAFMELRFAGIEEKTQDELVKLFQSKASKEDRSLFIDFQAHFAEKWLKINQSLNKGTTTDNKGIRFFINYAGGYIHESEYNL